MWLPGPLLALRNRVLSDPGFQRWAVAFPLTRWIARRQSRELFDIAAGFVYSQILYACVQLRLFEILAEGVQSVEQLAGRLDLPPEGARRLLRAAVSLRLAEARGRDRFALSQLGAAVLGNAGVTAMVSHHSMAYADLRDPVALLRGEAGERELLKYWAYVDAEQPAAAAGEAVGGYSELMADSQRLLALDVVDAYSLADHQCLLDVGGGDGTFLVAAAKRWPHLRVILFDLPAVAERARARFAREGLSDRATAIGGDALRDPLPRGADVVSLVRVLHDHDDAVAQDFLRQAHQALPAGGRLLVAEPMSGTPGVERIGDAYFGFYLLAMGSGRPRHAYELKQMLREAGFDGMRQRRTRLPLLTQLMVARRV